ncbi:MAG: protein-glutamate O-methyltransferase CheR [Candidatus Omnitrophica bacterium]|nr:protein-glutamate O-methyltransferase CheR [Candidatus Omnitrophota bacterium]
MIMKTEKKNPYLDKILERVRRERGLDFSQYRPAILGRRVMARVALTKRDDFEQYYAYLRFHPEEMDYLMDSLTINVTEFFRDSYVFDTIEKKVIPELFERKKALASNLVHIWSCGSSSGEEAYSVLMLIAEHLGSKLANYNLKIYGTDIDSTALAKANEGAYEAAQFKRLSESRRQLVDRYFHDIGNKRYWIREEWPAYMDFRYHDIIADVALEHMDIILCRNLFIYFNRDLQNQVLERFWHSLNNGGFLILGNVETLYGSIKEKFVEYDTKAKIYVKAGG